MTVRSAFDTTWWERFRAWLRRRQRPQLTPGNTTIRVVCSRCPWETKIQVGPGLDAASFARMTLSLHEFQHRHEPGWTSGTARRLPPATPTPRSGRKVQR